MKITTKTAVIMALLILLLGATGYFGLTSLYKKADALEEIANELNMVSRLNLSLHEAVSYLNNYVVTGDLDERERFKNASAEVKELFENIYEIEEGAAKADASLENAKRLYANIDIMAVELFKYEVPMDSKDAVSLMLEIQQTADWISRLYIQVHELKDRGKLERVIKEAESTKKWTGLLQIVGTVIVLVVGFILFKNKQ